MKPYIKLGGAIEQALPDRRLVRLSQKDIQHLKTASEVAVAIVAVAGVAAISVVAPNLFQALNTFLPKGKKYRHLYHRQKTKKVAETFYYLKRSGLVKFERSKGEWLMSLTELGKKRLPGLELTSLRVPKAKKWDGCWWLVAADIPTKKFRRGADCLRQKLKDMGFYSLQRTLWLYPFDPRKEIEFVVQAFGIGQFVTVMKIAELDIQDREVLRAYFTRQGVI